MPQGATSTAPSGIYTSRAESLGQCVEASITSTNYLLADSGHGAAGSPRSAVQASLHIDANTVLCIAQEGVQPSAKPVQQKGRRPAGIAVYRVSPLGIGVLDGDVLTDVLGQHVTSQAQVVAIVIAARSANMATISGTLWRGMRPYTITVEQPYDIPNCAIEESDCWRSRCGDNKRQNAANSRGTTSGTSKNTKQGAKR